MTGEEKDEEVPLGEEVDEEVADAPAAIDTKPPQLEPPPAAIEDLASACVRFVKRALGVELDFTPDTLPLLDHYVQAARATREKPEPTEVVVEAAGAYLGEVVRRRYASWWKLGDGVHVARLQFRDLFLAFSPMDMVRDAISAAVPGVDDAALSFDLASFELDDVDKLAVLTRLGELPEVPIDEYYAPSTRIEVLDIIIDAVRARRIGDQDPPLDLEPADYDT